MAQAQITPTSPGTNPGASQGLLASCRGTVYLLKNQKWDPLFGSNIYRFHLVRQAGTFILFVVSDPPKIAIKAKIVLRYNTVFKKISGNFFSLLDNGLLVWGFNITSQPNDAQTFAIVIQNLLTSLKESHVTAVHRPAANVQPTVPVKHEPKGEQQVYLHNICLTLSDAIGRGNEQFASDLAKQLAVQKALVKIRLDEPEQNEAARKDNKINLKVQVEDKESAGCSFRLDVAPQITIHQLREMVQVKYNFPAAIQHWIIGKRLPKPNETLLDCGIKTSGHTLYLYLISPDTADVARAKPREAWGGTNERHEDRVQSDSDIAAGPDCRIGPDPRSLPNMPSEWVREVPLAPIGWTCKACTFVNSPSRPGCEICSTARPSDYQIPNDYIPDEKERKRLEQEIAGDRLILEDVMATRDQAADHCLSLAAQTSEDSD